ncbi:hypothetical protein [Paenibacillus sp. NPDC058177]|uniref:hypothetical protein n=1 Tax=Paenibacillus sp. NPDC058177 TaxID=3346369 RepID=UPI0036DB44C2
MCKQAATPVFETLASYYTSINLLFVTSCIRALFKLVPSLERQGKDFLAQHRFALLSSLMHK